MCFSSFRERNGLVGEPERREMPFFVVISKLIFPLWFRARSDNPGTRPKSQPFFSRTES